MITTLKQLAHCNRIADQHIGQECETIAFSFDFKLSPFEYNALNTKALTIGKT